MLSLWRFSPAPDQSIERPDHSPITSPFKSQKQLVFVGKMLRRLNDCD